MHDQQNVKKITHSFASCELTISEAMWDGHIRDHLSKYELLKGMLQ
jgi:hypothetical protein